MPKHLIAIIVAAAIFITVVTANGIDQEIDNPGKTARNHILNNIDEIRDLVQAEMERKGDWPMPVHHQAIVYCWPLQDPAQVPSEEYTVQKCRIRFGPRPLGDVQAIYTVVMERKDVNFTAILESPNHPIRDAYLELDTITANPNERLMRLGPTAKHQP